MNRLGIAGALWLAAAGFAIATTLVFRIDPVPWVVTLALAWLSDERAAEWRDVRLALGSVAATPIRAARTETILEGTAPSEETADRAASTLASELSPIDDVRSTADYQRLAAGRILHRLIRDEGNW